MAIFLFFGGGSFSILDVCDWALSVVKSMNIKKKK